ncbi:MAG TPA: adenosylcobinamide-GDP ribazoletransferase [Acidimicrobiales bacterium]|jgi:adenosylcobinamide-GDP ribazoletransferase|nr:adenosylcobinamide-GDP ribazoletransferase [Acidimicrobiales bacterium]
MRRALAFLTPFGVSAAPSSTTFGWFPLVGAAIGLAVGGVWWAADRAWPPVVAAAVTVSADIGLTGYLHLDGLADSADGLLPPLTRPRRLDAMRDPAVGAFGAVTVIAVLLLRFGALASTPAAPLVVAGLWCGSRTGMVVIARTLRYARPEGGLVTAFVPTSPSRWTAGTALFALAGVALALILAALGHRTRGLAAVGAEAAAVAAVAWLSQRRIGGFTGDVLGAAGVVGETVGLLVLAAR